MEPPNDAEVDHHILVDDNDNTPSASTLTDLLLPELRSQVLGFLDANDLAELSCVCHQLQKECAEPSLPSYRTAFISYVPPMDPMDLVGFISLHPLVGALMKMPTAHNHSAHSYPQFAKRFTRLKVQGVSQLPKLNNRDAKSFVKGLTLSHVTHLDISSTSQDVYQQVAPSIARLLTQIVPNLKGFDLSHNQVSTAMLADCARHCPQLEQMTIKNGICGGVASVTGVDWKNCHPLRELILDHTLLQASDREANDIFADPDNADACPLRCCRENLQRVSLKGCRYYNRMPKNATKAGTISEPFTQLGLIKFVRNAPNLSWFRSDLTQENVSMLQEEYPNITFVG